MTDTRELVERLRQWDGCWPAPGLEHDVERAADTITALSERVRVLEEERYKLACAICGGEDFPGLLDGTGAEALVEIARKDAAMHMETIDRAIRAEEALRPFANIADLFDSEVEGHSDTDELSLFYGDGANWLADRFTLAQFNAARAALTSGRRG